MIDECTIITWIRCTSMSMPRLTVVGINGEKRVKQFLVFFFHRGVSLENCGVLRGGEPLVPTREYGVLHHAVLADERECTMRGT